MGMRVRVRGVKEWAGGRGRAREGHVRWRGQGSEWRGGREMGRTVVRTVFE